MRRTRKFSAILLVTSQLAASLTATAATTNGRGFEINRNSAVVITFDSYPFSTRARKIAVALGQRGMDVTFLGMARPGRTGRWTEPGTNVEDGITVVHVNMKAPLTEPSLRNLLVNPARSYLPAISRMIRHLVLNRYDLAVTISASLSWLGILHKVAHRGRLWLDINERPGAVKLSGSGASLVSPIEAPLIRLASRWADIGTAVVPPDVETLRAYGFSKSILLRNAPLNSWRANYRQIPAAPIRFVLIGSIFESRGFEMLIDAVRQIPDEIELTVDVYGTGRSGYVEELIDRTDRAQQGHRIHWKGPLERSKVSSTYLDAHVGLVLYESNDLGNDGLSNKLMECVSSGRPVLAGSLPQNQRFVHDHGFGWTCEMTIEGLAAGILQVHRDFEKVDAIAAACRAAGDTWLNWDAEVATAADAIEA